MITKAELIERLELELLSGSPDETPGLCRPRYAFDPGELIRLCLEGERLTRSAAAVRSNAARASLRILKSA